MLIIWIEFVSHRQDDSNVDGNHDDCVKHGKNLCQSDLVVGLGEDASPDEDADDDDVEDQRLVVREVKCKGESPNQHENDAAWT